MPLQFDLAKSSRRIAIDPVVPSVTVGALAGRVCLMSTEFCARLDFLSESAPV
jgi:hypothetical protein